MEGLRPAWKDIMMGGVRYPGVVNVLSGDGTSGSVVWLRVMVHVKGNYENVVGNPCRLPKEDHGEEGQKNHRRYMVNTAVHRGVEGV